MRAVFHPALSWKGRSAHFSAYRWLWTGEDARPSTGYRPLMHSINNSSWTQREPDTKVVAWADIGNGAKAEQQSSHSMHTVVTNNSAGNVELFRLHPIEWLRGIALLPIFASLGGDWVSGCKA
jgi:hypothetical protein